MYEVSTNVNDNGVADPRDCELFLPRIMIWKNVLNLLYHLRWEQGNFTLVQLELVVY